METWTRQPWKDKTWKQPKCPNTGEWISKMYLLYPFTHTHTHTHTHTGILLSHKKGQNNAISSNTDEPREDHAK